MKLGTEVTRTPETIEALVDGGKSKAIKLEKRPMRGKVMYIHRKGRYHVVEFDTPGGKIRESFLGVGS